MLSWLRGRNQDQAKAREIYGAVVAAARNPRYFRDLGVADTPEGRYEMIVLFLALALMRLAGAKEPGSSLARTVAETFVTDLDDAMREMGVGDLSVPRKVKGAAGGLYDRMQAYGTAIGAGEPGLAEVLAAAVPGLAEGDGARVVAASAMRARDHLAGISDEAVLAGRLTFPSD